MTKNRSGRVTFGAFLSVICASLGTIAHAQNVTWTLRPGSQLTQSVTVNTTLDSDPTMVTVMTVTPQVPGSLVSPTTGTLKTTGNFLSAVDFGPFPIDQMVWDNRTLPTPSEAFAAIFAASAVALGGVQGNTMSDVPAPGPLPVPGGGAGGYAPDVDPSDPLMMGNPALASTVMGVPATAPANFAYVATDPVHMFYPGTAVWLAASRGIRSGLWTDGTPPSVDLTAGETFGDFAVGATAGPGGGSTRSVSTSTFDFNTAGLLGYVGVTNSFVSGGAGAVPIPVLGDGPSDNPMDKGTLSRDGAKYVMTIHFTDFANAAENSALPAIGGFPARHLNVLSTFTNVTIAEADLDPGDVTFNGAVDIFDVNLVSANWSGDNPGPSGGLTPGDANGDGKVNIFDINMVSANWNPSGGGVAVPEPGSAILLILGVLFLAIRLRLG